MRPHYLNNFFHPHSIAIVGASERPESVGHRLMLNIIESGFTGEIYPVNLKHHTILGHTTYTSIEALPDTPDLVVISTPAPTVPELIHQAGEKGVKAVIVITAGFSELGGQGKRLELEAIDIAHRYNIRIIGPNCLGVICPSGRLNATFGDGLVDEGSLALVS